MKSVGEVVAGVRQLVTQRADGAKRVPEKSDREAGRAVTGVGAVSALGPESAVVVVEGVVAGAQRRAADR